MAMSIWRRAALLLVLVILLVAPGSVYSCGPFLESAVFSFQDQPDGPREDFAAGTLGIVRPGFRYSYLVVAYRYLSGLKLTPEQQKAAIEVWNGDVVPEHPSEEDEVANWGKARGQVPNLPSAPEISPYATVSKDQPYFQYVNCPGNAFQSATRTLNERAGKFGLASATMREWVTGQDQVFANCNGEAHLIPATLDSGDALLRADRAYQIAAAHFYGRDFDQAAAEFDEIAKDSSSPWAGIAPYLAARALIRKADLVHKQTEQFDAAAMAAAQQQLENIVHDPKEASIHEPAARLLDFVRFRTEPAKRVAELDSMLLSQDLGQNFKQNLWDYVLLVSRGEQGSDPSDWLETFYALGGDWRSTPSQQSDAAKHALERWRETKSLPWLIAALAGAKPADSEVHALLTAANQVAPAAAGSLTVRYYALRLQLATGQADAARKELDRLLGGKELDIPLGSHNLLNDQRLKITTSLEDFLQHASEAPVPSKVDFDTGADVPADDDKAKPGEPLFTHYSAEVFLKRLPLAGLLQAAQTPALPKDLRREVARAAWVRSILINDYEAAAKLQAVLQEVDRPLWQSIEPVGSAQSDAEKHFAAIFVILHNPGMKPSVRESSLRSATLGEVDNYRDNWWCTDMAGDANWGKVYSDYDQDVNLTFVDHDPNFPFPDWVSESQRAAASAEWKKLSGVGAAPNYLTSQVLEYAKQHPNDFRMPEALYLAIRSTRFGCTNIESRKFSKDAFDFLHEHYPESDWAKKTKYYY